MADLLDHVCDVGVSRWLDREKAWLEPLVGAIQIDPFKEDNMIMHIQINSATKALDKCYRSRLDFGPLETSCDRLVHVILTDRGANDRMDRGGEALRSSHPVPQRDRYRDDPLACRHPGNHALDQVGCGLGHAPAGTRGTKPSPFAAEGQ